MRRTLKIGRIVATLVMIPAVSILSAMVAGMFIVLSSLPYAASGNLGSPRELRAEMQRAGSNMLADLRSEFSGVDRITFDIPSLAPMAFIRFCIRYPQDCKVRGTADWLELVPLTEMRKAELVKVNREVNRAITPREKTSSEEWLVSPREGNCKDYAVSKRHELLVRGWPSHTLLLTEVIVPSGEHHLVLVVRTREDDLVLDNLDENVRPVSQIPYRWVRAQQPKNPRFWSTINMTRAS